MKLENRLKEFCLDWAVSHGLSVRSNKDSAVGTAQHAPITLFPSPFPRQSYERAVKLQTILNRLVDALVMDEPFLETFIQGVAEADAFVERLYGIHRKVYAQHKGNQLLRLAIMRMDYMLDAGDLNVPLDRLLESSNDEIPLKMIEFNTMAASMGSHCSKLADLHGIIMDRWLPRVKKHEDEDLVEICRAQRNGVCPPNPVIAGMANALFLAHQKVCALTQPASSNGNLSTDNVAILFVVQEGERNVFDQKSIEFELMERYGVACLRKTLGQLESAVIDAESQLLRVFDADSSDDTSSFLVSVAYFRAAYTPADFPTESHWSSLLKLESSRSVCCPTTGYQLIGLKKVQEILALEPHIMNRFLTEAEVQMVQSTFTGFYEMKGDSRQTQQTVDMILRNPQGYVLKPQREGGGNNIYGLDIPPLLSRLTPIERTGFIAMDLIRPPYVENYFCRDSVLRRVEKAVCELGIYGVYMVEMQVDNGESSSSELENRVLGHLLRTKALGTNEGGVAAGFAVIDSPCLI